MIVWVISVYHGDHYGTSVWSEAYLSEERAQKATQELLSKYPGWSPECMSTHRLDICE